MTTTMMATVVTWLLSIVSIALGLGTLTKTPSLATLRYRKRRRMSVKQRTHDQVSITPGTRAVSDTVHLRGSPRPRQVCAWGKLCEYSRWYFSEIWVRWQNNFRSLDYISSRARFSFYVFEPYYHWFGLNQRVVTTSGLNHVLLQNSFGGHDTCVNGGSFNYAGLYELPSAYEELQRKALKELPHSGPAVQDLCDELARRLATFFQADCCFLTSTGFGSNILGFPAIASKDWMIVMDEKCHNSMFSGAFLSKAAARRRMKHNDTDDLEAILESTSKTFSNIMVAVEGMYSMDGTLPPLGRLYELKQRYGFVLYCDEAHSFLSIGRTGRGCLEAWNDDHPTEKLPADVIDIRSATLSKAVGAIGGFVCATARFKSALCSKSARLALMCEPIPTAAVLQALWALIRPLHLAGTIARLHSISKFCHEELRRQGVFVYGEDAAPMLPVYAGSPTQASELSYLLRTLGLACPPISQPAVELWESRVRIGLSPSFTDKDVNTLVDAVVEASKKIGVLRPSRRLRHSFNSVKPNALEEQREMEMALREMSALINAQIEKTTKYKEVRTASHKYVIQAGYRALAKHGLGAGSSRFILGTFLPHLDAERVTSEYFGQPASITYGDAGLGLMSTVTALCRPICGYKEHHFLVPTDAGLAAEAGLRISPRNSGTTVQRYTDLKGLMEMIKLGNKRTYATIYAPLQQHVDNATMELSKMIAADLAHGQPSCFKHVTLLIDASSDCVLSEPIPDRSQKTIKTLIKHARSLGIRVLLSGSYRSLGGPSGGFLTGDQGIIEELRYSSRCYMFSTSPLPVHMAMVAATLETRLHGIEDIENSLLDE